MPELWLGQAVIYRNPAALTKVTKQEMGSNVDVTENPKDRAKFVAKYLLEYPFGGDGSSISPPDVASALETAVLPLRLGTNSRILLPQMPPVTFVSAGSGSFRLGSLWVGSEGAPREPIDAAAPESFGVATRVKLSDADCEALAKLAASLDAIDITPFEVPLGRFTDWYYRGRPVDQGIDLVVALEAMFSEGSESIAFKVAFRASCLMKESGQDRWDLYQFVKQAYSHRNNLVHGNKKRKSASDWFATNQGPLIALVRDCLLFFLTYRLRTGRVLDSKDIDEHLFNSGLLSVDVGTKEPSQFPVGEESFVARLV